MVKASVRQKRARFTYALRLILVLSWKLRDYMFAGRMEFSLHLHNAINSFGIIVVFGVTSFCVCLSVCVSARAEVFAACMNQRIAIHIYIDMFFFFGVRGRSI